MITMLSGRIAATLFALVIPIAYSQESSPCRDAERYPAPEPVSLIETGPLVVRHVFGRAVIQSRRKTIPGSELHDACMSLFTVDSHKFVASARIDKRGHFEFSAVRPGEYRLIARALGFCTGNKAIRVTSSASAPSNRGIIVYFRLLEIDSCTTVEYDCK